MIKKNSSQGADRVIVLLLLLTFGVILSGCSDLGKYDSKDTSAGSGVKSEIQGMVFSFELPLQLQAAGKFSNLTASVVIDNGEAFALTVDPVTHEVSGTLEDIQVGEHEITIAYFEGNIVLATSTKVVNVVAGDNPPLLFVTLNRNYDEDGDGYTNLAEVRIGTNPANSSDVPANGGGFEKSANYLSVSSIGLALSAANSFVSESYNVTPSEKPVSSESYTITSSF